MVLPDGSVLAPHLLMLCADQTGYVPLELAEPEPDYPDDERDYGGLGVDEDFLRDEMDRLALEAQLVSSGRGSKPDYPLIITDRDRAAALSAEAGISDTDIIEAAGELAGGYGVSTDAVHAMAHDAHIRSGLGHSLPERARVLAACQVALSRGGWKWTTSSV